MSMYEFYELQEQICWLRFELMSDQNMRKFWRNAAEGYNKKKQDMTIAEAERE